MTDRLLFLLKWFELRARVFQSGPLCRTTRYDAGDGLGYIHVLRGGAMRLETAGRRPQPVDRPTLILYLRPVTHCLVPDREGADMVCASFEFGARLHNPLLYALPDVVLLELEEIPALQATLELLFREASECHCGRQAVLDRLSEVVIIQLLRELMNQGRLHSGLLAGLADRRLAKAINGLHAEPAKAWSLEELAAIAGMSRARFAARFRATVGNTPMGYLSEWRLGIAQSLLRRGTPVQAVAEQVGYANASAFARAFSAHTGVSPRTWAAQNEAPSGGGRVGDKERDTG